MLMSKKLLSLHLEILDDERHRAFVKLTQFTRYGILGGGTALALILGHRHSYDFDWFCTKPISDALRTRAIKTFGVTQILIDTEDEFTFLNTTGIKFTFLHYPFTFLDKPVTVALFPPLLSVLSVGVSKAYAMSRRAAWRDYVDLYTILTTTPITLEKTIATAARVYGELFSTKMFLGQLLYTKDISEDEIKGVQWLAPKVSGKVIKDFLKKEVERVGKIA